MSRSRLLVLLQTVLALLVVAIVVAYAPSTPTVGAELATNGGLAIALAFSA